MDNEYLRLLNEERLKDNEIIEYSVKKNIAKKKAPHNNTAISLIFDEIYNKTNTLSLSQTSTKMPKLLDSIVFSLVVFLIGVLLGVLTYIVRDFFLLELLIVYISIFMPLSFIYFFYRLDVKGSTKFSTLVYCVSVGVAIFIMSELLFESLIKGEIKSYHSNVAIRCLFEFLSISIVCFFMIKGMRKVSGATTLLIACAVAAGFSFSRSLSENFTSLLINVSVSPSGESVGAILNIQTFIRTSAKNVITLFPSNSVYKPFIFISLSIIIVKISNNDVFSRKKKIITSILTLAFCFITYILSSLQTPFSVLTILYNLISLIFTAYLFINAINDCLSSEKYD